jgi:hypothetical protein
MDIGCGVILFFVELTYRTELKSKIETAMSSSMPTICDPEPEAQQPDIEWICLIANNQGSYQ